MTRFILFSINDIFRYKINSKTDKFFALFCDGMYEALDINTINDFILTNSFDPVTKKRINVNVNIARKLCEYAIAKGSTDNVTCIIVYL